MIVAITLSIVFLRLAHEVRNRKPGQKQCLFCEQTHAPFNYFTPLAALLPLGEKVQVEGESLSRSPLDAHPQNTNLGTGFPERMCSGRFFLVLFLVGTRKRTDS